MTPQLADDHQNVAKCAAANCVLLGQVEAKLLRIEPITEVWKWIATTLGGVLIGLTVFWFSGASQAVTREGMESFIRSYSPYAVDRQMVTSTLQELKDGQKDLSIRMSRLEAALAAHTATR